MKSLPLLIVCTFTFFTAHAESPIREKSSPIDLAQSLNSVEEILQLEIIDDSQVANAQESIHSLTHLSPEEDLIDEEEELAKPAYKFSSEETIPLEALKKEDALPLVIESTSKDLEKKFEIQLDFKRAFAGAPLIYTLLLGMSLFSVFIWLYSLLSLKKIAKIPSSTLNNLHGTLSGNHFDEALSLCQAQDGLLFKMLVSGIQSRKYGLSIMLDSMKTEGKRLSTSFWQKIGLLNDIAILAPMLGLLGTVIGMFYAFYDVNRSIDSISSLFDGLGVSVGTTVAGLIVAIIALILHSTVKYRLIRMLSQTESEAYRIASLIDNHASLYTNQPK